MLDKTQKLAIYLEQNLSGEHGKMGQGVMRYCLNPIVCIIDSAHAGKKVSQVCKLPRDYPVVASIQEASKLGAEVLVLGIAPSGGRVPENWIPPLEEAIRLGMSIVNGLHDQLHERFQHLLREGQWIWDIRQPGFIPPIATAQAAMLDNTRILMVGTDMSIGKMTAGLELYRWVRDQGLSTTFLATGQIGITITGQGIPLDAFKVDHACGAVESMVMSARDYDYVFIEGQGSLVHPGSTATLPLLRGSCANRLVMCHRAGMQLTRAKTTVPPLRELIQLNEDLAACCGSLTKAKTIGVALNTSEFTDQAAAEEIQRLEDTVGLPVADVVRCGAEKLGRALLDS